MKIAIRLSIAGSGTSASKPFTAPNESNAAKAACTDLCGGPLEKAVPTATPDPRSSLPSLIVNAADVMRFRVNPSYFSVSLLLPITDLHF